MDNYVTANEKQILNYINVYGLINDDDSDSIQF